MPATSTSVTFSRRARSSRRWSASAILPSSPIGVCGLTLNRPRTPVIDTSGGRSFSPGSAVGVGRRALLRGRVGGLDGACLGGPVLRVDLLLLLGLRLVVVVDQALGLCLEDAQGAATAAGQLGELLGTEEQDQDAEDD